MNETKIAQQREFDLSFCSYDESNVGSYEDYGKKRLPGAYTAYKKDGQADEIVFGRNDSDYEGAETPDQGEHEISYASKKSCCKIGWL